MAERVRGTGGDRALIGCIVISQFWRFHVCGARMGSASRLQHHNFPHHQARRTQNIDDVGVLIMMMALCADVILTLSRTRCHGTGLGESYNGRSGLTVITGVRLIESVQEESFFDPEALALAN